jgi:hypothetical protein
MNDFPFILGELNFQRYGIFVGICPDNLMRNFVFYNYIRYLCYHTGRNSQFFFGNNGC